MDALGIFGKFVWRKLWAAVVICHEDRKIKCFPKIQVKIRKLHPKAQYLLADLDVCVYECISPYTTLVCIHSHSHDFGWIWIHPSYSIGSHQKANRATQNKPACSFSSRAAMHCALTLHVWRSVGVFYSCTCIQTSFQKNAATVTVPSETHLTNAPANYNWKTRNKHADPQTMPKTARNHPKYIWCCKEIHILLWL